MATLDKTNRIDSIYGVRKPLENKGKSTSKASPKQSQTSPRRMPARAIPGQREHPPPIPPKPGPPSLSLDAPKIFWFLGLAGYGLSTINPHAGALTLEGTMREHIWQRWGSGVVHAGSHVPATHAGTLSVAAGGDDLLLTGLRPGGPAFGQTSVLTRRRYWSELNMAQKRPRQFEFGFTVLRVAPTTGADSPSLRESTRGPLCRWPSHLRSPAATVTARSACTTPECPPPTKPCRRCVRRRAFP